ncbi:MAG TPA: isopeptide-forming domain-containing fimbrial protein [Bacteroidia bacterium]|nr:isopeptide-forming domain-containing fimbrial protein [Bacteroidia bacterium]
MKKKLLLLFALSAFGMMISQSAKAQVALPISVFDSMSVYCNLPANVYFYVNGSQAGPYLPTDSVTMDVAFGDGTSSTTKLPLYQGGSYYWGIIEHTYNLPGQFSVQFMVTWPDNDVDTLVYGPVYIGPCGNIEGTVFVDDNADCIFNTGDTFIPYASIVVTDQGGATYLYSFADSAGHYSIGLPLGVNFNISVSSYMLSNVTVSCPSGGSYAAVATGTTQNLDFGITCNNQYDLEVNLHGWRFRPGFVGWLNTSVYNNSCYPANNASSVLNLDPLVSYSSDYWGIPSSSVVGQDVNWTNLSAGWWGLSHHAGTEIYTPLSAQIGDSVCFTYSASPTLNDADPSNNTMTKCYVVSNSWDPNAKEVYPQGLGPQGYVPQNTNFEYTIHFQNTGTDTAYNISVVDTIDVDLDFSTLVVTGSSHPMTINVIDNHIMKFNFYNIMLPDSGANMAGSEGFVTYKVKAKPNAIAGTEWKNTAYIYFDFNEAIITNTTLNTLDMTTGIENMANLNLQLSPNPANDNVLVNFEQQFTGKLVITDITGRIVKDINVNNASKFNLNTSDLSNGSYQITTIGNMNSNAKIQVMH